MRKRIQKHIFSSNASVFLHAKVIPPGIWRIPLIMILCVDDVECIGGIPLILDDYCPWLAGLPLYILRLSTEVDYGVSSEKYNSCKKKKYFVVEKKFFNYRKGNLMNKPSFHGTLKVFKNVICNRKMKV